ncbi:MAG: hypothetical protein ACOYB8_01745 [Eubacteriaceae bacterium]|jgi:PAS domain S-box-containing protein
MNSEVKDKVKQTEMFNHLPCSVCIYTAEVNPEIVYMNLHFMEMVGLDQINDTGTRPAGPRLLDYIPEEEHSEVRADITGTVSSGDNTILQFNRTFRRSDDKICFASGSTELFRKDSKGILILSIFNDVTEQKELQYRENVASFNKVMKGVAEEIFGHKTGKKVSKMLSRYLNSPENDLFSYYRIDRQSLEENGAEEIPQDNYRILQAYANLNTFEYDPVTDVFKFLGPVNNNKRENTVIRNFMKRAYNGSLSDFDVVRSFADAMTELLKKGGTSSLEFQSGLLSPDIRWYRASFVCVTDDAGNRILIAGRVDDIHESKNESLRIQEMLKNAQMVQKPVSRVYIRTFGYFDVIIDGQAIPFQYRKTKELLALLVDRRGGFIAPEEVISCLWENEQANKTTLARYRKVAMRLRKELEKYDAEDVIESRKGKRRLVPEKVTCDLYNYLDGEASFADSFKGSYMTNYSWGERTLAELSHNQRNPELG